MADTKKPLILVDGSSYLYRAFYALPPLQTSKGQPTGAVRGVISMIKRLLKDYQPEHIAVVFDAKGKTFRDEMYSEYKANRPPMPDDLRAQIEPLHKAVELMGLPMLIIDGVEADDVIGTLCREATEQGVETIVSTGDKDMAQLVSDHVTLINTMNDTTMDRDGVIDKFGVPPETIIDYLALVGDTSDNVPGVPKCGPKTAVKWLAQYGSLDGLVANADEIKGKVGENLRGSLEMLPLAKSLVTIKTDVELEQGINDLTLDAPNEEELLALFKELEFKSWVTELEAAGAQTDQPLLPENIEIDYDTVLDESSFEKWLEKLAKAELFAFDTETTSLNYMVAELVGVSFSVEPGKAAYVPVNHRYPGAPEQLPLDVVLEKLKPLLESDTPKIIGQNLKYDRNVLHHYGITLMAIAADTMLESYVIDSVGSNHDMDSLAEKYLNHKTVHYEDIAGKGAKQLTFDQVGLEEAANYAAEDADITLRLHNRLMPKLEDEEKLLAVYRDMELPLLKVLSKIECTGAKIDADELRQQSQHLAERMQQLQAQAYEEAGAEFNLGSPKQLGQILFEKLKLPVIKKTAKKAPSTAEDVLQELALDYPLPKLILEYRSASKLKSTYTDKLPQLIDQKTGRIHTSYHQAVTATGRLSSSDPNLQNIPVRTEDGRLIRQAFVAEKGCQILAADYSQIELRIMAHLSGDEGLLNAFNQGLDIHKATAAEVEGIAIDEVSAEQRRNAKAVNFGLIYGMSAFGLAKQLGIGRREAQGYIDAYFDKYPGVLQYMESTRELARKQGYVETLFGRRLYLPEINTRNPMRRQAAERTAINAPMQGTAADIIKRAMLAVDSWLTEEKLAAVMIMQVHDELVLEVPESEVKAVSEGLKNRMGCAAELAVPLVVDVGIGDNWEQAH